MARYTAWKLSRRLGISKRHRKRIRKRPYAPGHSTNVRNFQNTVYNYKRNKNFVTCTA